MQLLPKGKNQTIIVSEDKQGNHKEIFFSYQTPVAAYLNGKAYKTSTKHSQTTTRHINDYLKGIPAETREQSFFNNLI
jgi:hypothetical protein